MPATASQRLLYRVRPVTLLKKGLWVQVENFLEIFGNFLKHYRAHPMTPSDTTMI